MTAGTVREEVCLAAKRVTYGLYRPSAVSKGAHSGVRSQPLRGHPHV